MKELVCKLVGDQARVDLNLTHHQGAEETVKRVDRCNVSQSEHELDKAPASRHHGTALIQTDPRPSGVVRLGKLKPH